jgi:tetratricopeptide (TPR) repeat protein
MDKKDRSSRPFEFMPLRRKWRGIKKTHRLAAVKQLLLHYKGWTIIAAILIIAAITFGVTTYLSRHEQQPASNSEVVQYYEKNLPQLSDKVKQTPDNLTVHRDYAVALYATGDIKGAKQQYEAAIKLKSNDAILHNNLANTYRDLKEYDKAMAAYETAIKLDPQHQNAYINLANLQMNMLNKPDDAIATYKRAIAAMPEDDQLKVLLGLAYEQSNNIPQAIQTFKNIVEKHPDHKAAQSNLERLGVK